MPYQDALRADATALSHREQVNQAAGAKLEAERRAVDQLAADTSRQKAEVEALKRAVGEAEAAVENQEV